MTGVQTCALPICLGKPLKLINHPVRDTIPIWWAALKDKSVEATAETADGWIPIFYLPEKAHFVWGDALRLGNTRRSASLAPLQTLAGGDVMITDDQHAAATLLDEGRPQAALYIGGMGARGKNFYNDILSAYGWEKAARTIQDLYLDGKKKEAATAIPADYLSATALVGPLGHVKERLAAYREAGVTHLQMSLHGSLDQRVATVEAMRKLADEG